MSELELARLEYFSLVIVGLLCVATLVVIAAIIIKSWGDEDETAGI